MILLINMRWSIMLARVFVIVMMAFVFQWSNNYTNHVVVGEYDAVWLKGFYNVEAYPNSYRWSGAQTTVDFPAMNGGWNVGILDLQNGQTSLLDQVTVILTTATHQQLKFVVKSATVRQYEILLPPAQ